jgi:2-hydroxychromene-2-carboxylate isomerase
MIAGLAGENPDHYSSLKMGGFAQAVMRAYWERDADINDPGVISALADDLGVSGDRLIAAANSDAARARLAAVTEGAIARGVFGAPMFLVDDEMFWGKDRLDFVERRLAGK